MNYIGRSKTPKTILLNLVVMLSMVCALGFSVLAQEGVNGRNVTMVEYSVDGSTVAGTFQQNSDGMWTDIATGSDAVYLYTETNRDDWTVYLSDGVSLNLWLKEAKVGGTTYTIVASYNDASTPVSTPPEEPVTVVQGTAVVTPVAGPTIEDGVNGRTVSKVEFSSDGTTVAGSFQQNSDGTWSESNGTVYQETNRDDWTVYLSNGASLNLWLKEAKKDGATYTIIGGYKDVVATVATVATTTTPATTTTATTTTPTTPTTSANVGPSLYNEASRNFPAWLEFSPFLGDDDKATKVPGGVKTDLPKETVELENGGSIEYTCSTVPYSITKTPQKLITLDPDSNMLYVGSILQGKGYIDGIGSFKELPIRQRAPVQISIDLLSGDNSITVDNPDVQSIDRAIGELIQRATASGLKSGGSIAYDKKSSTSLDEASVGLGLSVKYMGFSAKNKFNFASSASENTVLVNFTQKLFTVRMVQPQTPGHLFSDELTADILNQQISLGRLGADNIPVYVDSITYGRVMTFSFTSSASKQEIENALDVAYRTPTGDGGSGSLDVKTRKVLSEAKIGLVAIGGSESNALAAIRSGSIGAYFEAGTPLTTAEPISYSIRNLGADNSAAKVSDTLSYNVRTCEAQQKDAPVVAVELTVNLDRAVIHDKCDNGSDADLYGTFYINEQQFTRSKDDQAKRGNGQSLYFSGYTYPGLIVAIGQSVQFGGELLDADNNESDKIGLWNLSFTPTLDSSYGSFSVRSSPQCSSTLHYTITKTADLKLGNPKLR